MSALRESLEYCKNVLWRLLVEEAPLTPDQRADVEQAHGLAEDVLDDTEDCTVEIAVKDDVYGWVLLGDFDTIAEAKEAADEYANNRRMVFGISKDRGSGHYEIEYETGEEE